MERKPNLTRQELYDLVWAHPVSKLAKVYGLSDRGFAKLCDRNSVPTPPRGYWAMSPAAKRGLKPPLLLESGIGQNVRMPVPATFSSDTSAGESRYRRLYDELVGSLPPVHVAKTLKNLHREIRKILDQDALWVASMRDSIWGGARSIYASSLARRQLRIRSALLEAMEARGFTIRNSGRTPSEIEIVVDHTPLRLKITEHVRQYRRRLTEEERADPSNVHATFKQGRVQTGLLRVKVEGYYAPDIPASWQEIADRSMEVMLHEVLAGLVVASVYLREKRDAERQQEKERQERENAHLAELEISRQKAERRRALHDRALNWRDACLIREYVAAVNAAAAKSPQEDPSDLKTWTTFALETADHLDPLVGGGATSLTPLRPPVPVYQRGEYKDPPDIPSQDARLRRNYGYPYLPYG